MPLVLQRRAGRLLLETGAPAHDGPIIAALARALHWQQLLETGAVQSGAALARAEGLTAATVNRLLRLALLAPDIMAALMAGRQPRRLTLLWLMRNDIPVLWQKQRQILERLK